MRKQSIIEEIDNIIYNKDGKVSFRNIARDLNISPSTISYQFKSQLKLYEEYIDYKFKNIVIEADSFSILMSEIVHLLVELYSHLEPEVGYIFTKQVINYLNSCSDCKLDTLYKSEFPTGSNLKKSLILATLMNISMYSAEYEADLGLSLTEKEDCLKLVKLVANGN